MPIRSDFSSVAPSTSTMSKGLTRNSWSATSSSPDTPSTYTSTKTKPAKKHTKTKPAKNQSGGLKPYTFGPASGSIDRTTKGSLERDKKTSNSSGSTTVAVTNEGGQPAVETTSTADVSLKPTLTAASGSTVTTSTDSSGHTETEVTSEDPVKVEPKIEPVLNLSADLDKKSSPLPWIVGGALLLLFLSRK